MKAICISEFGGPEVLKLEDVPDPRPPQSGEVVERVNAAGVNPYDTYMRSGGVSFADRDGGNRTARLPIRENRQSVEVYR